MADRRKNGSITVKDSAGNLKELEVWTTYPPQPTGSTVIIINGVDDFLLGGEPVTKQPDGTYLVQRTGEILIDLEND